jgi:hypothetical protein
VILKLVDENSDGTACVYIDAMLIVYLSILYVSVIVTNVLKSVCVTSCWQGRVTMI